MHTLEHRQSKHHAQGPSIHKAGTQHADNRMHTLEHRQPNACTQHPTHSVSTAPSRPSRLGVRAGAVVDGQDSVSQSVAGHLRDAGYTFYRESMLVLGHSRRYVQAHTCALTHKHPCTHTRTHADTHTLTSHKPKHAQTRAHASTSHKPKHAHTRAHAQKRAHTRPRTPCWSALTSIASMEVDHPAVATMLVASSGTVLPAPIIPFRGRFWAQRAR